LGPTRWNALLERSARAFFGAGLGARCVDQEQQPPARPTTIEYHVDDGVWAVSSVPRVATVRMSTCRSNPSFVVVREMAGHPFLSAFPCSVAVPRQRCVTEKPRRCRFGPLGGCRRARSRCFRRTLGRKLFRSLVYALYFRVLSARGGTDRISNVEPPDFQPAWVGNPTAGTLPAPPRQPLLSLRTLPEAAKLRPAVMSFRGARSHPGPAKYVPYPVALPAVTGRALRRLRLAAQPDRTTCFSGFHPGRNACSRRIPSDR